MAKNRKAAEAVLLRRIEQCVPGGPSPEIYRQQLAQMSDEQFDALMMKFKNKVARPVLYVPNLAKQKMTIEIAQAMAEEMGHEFYQRLWITPSDGSPAYLTNKKYLVTDQAGRRQAQLLDKKIRIPRHNRSIDELTGQAAGESKGSSISNPELQVMAALNLDSFTTELIKLRGGDIAGFDAMNNMIDKTGVASIEAVTPLSSGVESTRALNIYLTAMHLSNSL